MKSPESKIILYGYLSAIAATLFWSGNFTVARGVTEQIPPVNLAFWRWTTATVILFPFAIQALLADWNIIKKNISYLCITSILGVSLFNTLIYIAGHSTSAMNMSLIAITFPVFVILISRLIFKEMITTNKWLGILLVFSGVITLITKGELSVLVKMSFTRGDIWMLLAAIAFAVYSILIRHRPAKLSARTFQLSTFLIGLVFLLPFYVWETSTTGFQIQSINTTTLYSVLYLGIFASLASYFLWSNAVSSLGPTKPSIIYYTLPVFSGLVAYLVLGEEIESIHIASMLLILLGVLTAIYEKNIKH